MDPPYHRSVTRQPMEEGWEGHRGTDRVEVEVGGGVQSLEKGLCVCMCIRGKA